MDFFLFCTNNISMGGEGEGRSGRFPVLHK